MKRHRKLVALLVALTFLFSIVAPVMAATPSEAEKAADKLNVLGIIEGYPDGSFGLDRNITRAEFAKIAVVAAGLKDAAEQLVNFPSQFSDVKVGEWYTGWINMAASQGFVKGDPAGTFRPNDNITYAEVVTVLVRLLGYNDNLPGPWPTNYLAKAVELGITDGVALNASAPAVRGDVFIMTSNTLDCETVKWLADSQTWREDEKLIAKSFKGAMFEGLVTDIRWDGKGNIELAILYDKTPNDREDKLTVEFLPVVDNVIVNGAADPYGLLGSRVDFIKNVKASGADRNAIVYLGVKDTNVVSHSEAKYVAGDYIELDKKQYDLASEFGVTYFPGTGDFDLDENQDIKNVDKVVVVLNDDGEAQWAFVYDYSSPDIIEEIDNGKIYGKVNGKLFESDSKKVQVIVKDGAIADLNALAEGDLVYVVEGTKNADVLVIAVSEVKEGTLERAKADYSALTIDGTAIDTDDDVLVSYDGGDSFGGKEEFSKDMFDEKVSYMLSPSGLIAVVISEVGAAQYQYGVVEAVNDLSSNVRGVEARIFTADGKVVYSIDSDFYKSEGNQYIKAGNLIGYEVDSTGKIDGGKAASADVVSFTEYDGNRAKISGVWYRVTDSTVFFGKDGEKNVVTTWDQFKKIAKSNGTPVQVILDEKTGVIKAIYYAGDITQGDNVGVIVDTGYNSGGYYYDIFYKGERVRYNTVSKQAIDGVAKKDFVKFTLSNGKIVSMSKVDYGFLVNGGKVQAATSSYVKVNDQYYYIDEDTMIVDITGGSAKLVSKAGRDDLVVIYGEDKGNVDVILIVSQALSEKSDQDFANEVMDLIETLPSTITLADKEKVEAARAAYDALTSAQKALVTNYDVLVAAEAELKVLVDTDAAAKVDELIGQIPTPVTLADKAKVEAARKAYDALTDDQKALVTKENDLEAAEKVIEAIEAINAATTTIKMRAAIANYSSVLGLNLTDYTALDPERKDAVADYLISEKPADGYQNAASIRAVFDEAVLGVNG